MGMLILSARGCRLAWLEEGLTRGADRAGELRVITGGSMTLWGWHTTSWTVLVSLSALSDAPDDAPTSPGGWIGVTHSLTHTGRGSHSSGGEGTLGRVIVCHLLGRQVPHIVRGGAVLVKVRRPSRLP